MPSSLGVVAVVAGERRAERAGSKRPKQTCPSSTRESVSPSPAVTRPPAPPAPTTGGVEPVAISHSQPTASSAKPGARVQSQGAGLGLAGRKEGHRPRPVHRAAAGTAGDSGGGRPARPAGLFTAVAWTLQTGAVHRETALSRAVEAGRAGQGSRGRAGHSRRCLDGPGYRGAEELAQRCPRPPPSLLSVPCEPCLADGAQGPSFAVDAEPV